LVLLITSSSCFLKIFRIKNLWFRLFFLILKIRIKESPVLGFEKISKNHGSHERTSKKPIGYVMFFDLVE
jgi:hypothetical protein